MSSTTAPTAWNEIPTERDGADTRHDVGTGPRIHLSVFVIVVLGCCLSVGAYHFAGQAVDNAKRESFRADAFQRIAELRRRVDTTINTLHAVRGLFAASKSVDRREFSQFINAIQLAPGVQALEWVPKVSADGRQAFEQRARREGLSNFRITERDESGGMRRAGRRGTYFPVYFLEPIEGNETAIGFDLASDPTRYQALQQARDTGKAVATVQVTLAQEKGDQDGFLVFRPVYRNGSVNETVRERRQNLTGFVLGVFRIGDLVEGIFETPETKHSAIDVWIRDLSASDGNQMLHPVSSSTASALDRSQASFSDRFVVSENLTVGGREWRVFMTPSRAAAASSRAWQPWTVLVAGFLFTALGALYMRQFLSHSRAVEILVHDQSIALKEATADLQRSNHDLEHFAYIASHDLKAPLRNIDNLAEWIEDDLGDALEGDTRESMTLLRGRVTRLRHLLDDLLHFSRVGREDCQVTRVDTAALIDEIADLLQPPTGIEITTVGELPQFDTLKGPLDQVFRNLIDNAIKHHDRETGCIEISAVERDGFFTFSVADDGPGIDPKYHERVFQVFKTLKPRDMVEGSGMGLAIVLKQVERRGGHIRLFSSAEERGATFEFDWPKFATDK